MELGVVSWEGPFAMGLLGSLNVVLGVKDVLIDSEVGHKVVFWVTLVLLLWATSA